jgi:hypothetical protein
MSLISEQVELLRAAQQKFKRKEITIEEMHAWIASCNAVHKHINSAIQIYAIDSKNRRAMNGLKKTNIFDEDTAIDLGFLPPSEPIKCLEKDSAVITREECLDYSGSHIDDCRSCDHFAATREKLLDQ